MGNSNSNPGEVYSTRTLLIAFCVLGSMAVSLSFLSPIVLRPHNHLSLAIGVAVLAAGAAVLGSICWRLQRNLQILIFVIGCFGATLAELLFVFGADDWGVVSDAFPGDGGRLFTGYLGLVGLLSYCVSVGEQKRSIHAGDSQRMLLPVRSAFAFLCIIAVAVTPFLILMPRFHQTLFLVRLGMGVALAGALVGHVTRTFWRRDTFELCLVSALFAVAVGLCGDAYWSSDSSFFVSRVSNGIGYSLLIAGFVAKLRQLLCESELAYQQLVQRYEALEQAKAKEGEVIHDLKRINATMVGRESRVLELKEEVNSLSLRSGESLVYQIDGSNSAVISKSHRTPPKKHPALQVQQGNDGPPAPSSSELLHSQSVVKTARERTAELAANAAMLRSTSETLRQKTKDLLDGKRTAISLIEDAEQEKAKAEATERRMRMTFEAAPNGMVLINEAGVITMVNSCLEQTFGYHRTEMLGKPIEMLLPGELIESHVKLRNDFMYRPFTRRMGEGRELHGRHKSGRQVPVEVGLNPVALESGTYILAAIVDISERHNASKAMKKANEALRRSNEELEQFAYVASHDLQEPLRKVASFGELLQSEYGEKLDGDGETYLNYVVDGAKRMQILIRDLLHYSRVDSQGQPLKVTSIAVALKTSLRSLQLLIEETDAQVEFGELPSAWAEPQQLSQLFQNLISNGIKYCHATPPKIQIDVRSEENRWVVSVRDNGIGIDASYHERVFGIFKRLHGRSEFSGTGIGLAICKRIVERFGGEIWIESEEGCGSTFLFTLKKVQDLTSHQKEQTGNREFTPTY